MTTDDPPFRDPNADVAARVSDLLARMTLAEKLAMRRAMRNRKAAQAWVKRQSKATRRGGAPGKLVHSR